MPYSLGEKNEKGRGGMVLPALQKMCGKEGKGLERVMVRVAEKIKCDNDRVE